MRIHTWGNLAPTAFPRHALSRAGQGRDDTILLHGIGLPFMSPAPELRLGRKSWSGGHLHAALLMADRSTSVWTSSCIQTCSLQEKCLGWEVPRELQLCTHLLRGSAELGPAGLPPQLSPCWDTAEDLGTPHTCPGLLLCSANGSTSSWSLWGDSAR